MGLRDAAGSAADLTDATMSGDVPAAPALVPGLVIGRYRLLESLGGGGMGDVWRAWDERLKQTVAIKALLEPLHADPRAHRNFVREIRIACTVKNPYVSSWGPGCSS
jgi:serine/threonine protein kinase